MKPGARLATAIELLDEVLAGEPVSLALTRWSRQARYAGSRDRAAVRDVVYDCLRKKRSFAALAGGQSGRALVVARTFLAGDDLSELFTGQGHDAQEPSPEELAALKVERDDPDPVRLDYPDFLDGEIRRSLGADFEAVMEALRDRAPVDLRVNRAKGSVEEAQEALDQEDISTVRVKDVPTALRVVENPRKVGVSQAYKSGLVELQDASSQAVALFAGAKPGMNVLDYCAGGGGKALALYDAIQGQGRVVAHDIATVRMNDLPVRAARAGARIKVAAPADPALKTDAFDLVFVDAPCSGTGSWRRMPEAKWNIRPADLIKLDRIQAEILENAANYVRPGGLLVYATCSLLRSENQYRLQEFLTRFPDFSQEAEVILTPLSTGDGFYATRLRKTEIHTT